MLLKVKKLRQYLINQKWKTKSKYRGIEKMASRQPHKLKIGWVRVPLPQLYYSVSIKANTRLIGDEIQVRILAWDYF